MTTDENSKNISKEDDIVDTEIKLLSFSYANNKSTKIFSAKLYPKYIKICANVEKYFKAIDKSYLSVLCCGCEKLIGDSSHTCYPENLLDSICNKFDVPNDKWYHTSPEAHRMRFFITTENTKKLSEHLRSISKSIELSNKNITADFDFCLINFATKCNNLTCAFALTWRGKLRCDSSLDYKFLSFATKYNTRNRSRYNITYKPYNFDELVNQIPIDILVKVTFEEEKSTKFIGNLMFVDHNENICDKVYQNKYRQKSSILITALTKNNDTNRKNNNNMNVYKESRNIYYRKYCEQMRNIEEKHTKFGKIKNPVLQTHPFSSSYKICNSSKSIAQMQRDRQRKRLAKKNNKNIVIISTTPLRISSCTL